MKWIVFVGVIAVGVFFVHPIVYSADPSTAARMGAIAKETTVVVAETKSQEQSIHEKLMKSVESLRAVAVKVKALPPGQAAPPELLDEVVKVLGRTSEQFQAAAAEEPQLREELEAKFGKFATIGGRVDEEIDVLKQRRAEIVDRVKSIDQSNADAASIEQQGYQQAIGYLDQEIDMWQKFSQTQEAVRVQASMVSWRVTKLITTIRVSGVVYREAAELVALHRELQRARVVLAEAIPELDALTASMVDGWNNVDQLLTNLSRLSTPTMTSGPVVSPPVSAAIK
jgi:hypothetical protein